MLLIKRLNCLAHLVTLGHVKRGVDTAGLLVEDCKLEFGKEVNFVHIETTSNIHKAISQEMSSPVKVPKITTLPFARNSSFICRDEILKNINDDLYLKSQAAGSGTRSYVLHGMGGVGKTQTALEFAYRLAPPACCVFWLQAEEPAELAETFGRIARVLNLAKDAEIQDQTRLIILTQQWLSKNTNWLLIFDNVTDFKSIKSYWPTYPHGSVLVTTQNQDLRHSSTFSTHLLPMSEDEGARLLLKYLDHNDEESKMYLNDVENAKVISRELEGLPIAIAHVAGYVDGLKRPFPYFLQQLKERQRASMIWSMDSRNSTTQQYDRTLGAVWDLAFSALGQEARSLLDVMAILNPDSIPEDMLLRESNCDPVNFDRIRIELLGRHLVRIQGDLSDSAFAIHRSLQKGLLFRLDRDHDLRQKVFDRTVDLIRNCFPVQSPISIPVNHKWTVYERYLPHVLALHRFYTETIPAIHGTAAFAELLSDAGYYMWDRNLGWEGIVVLETAERICLQDENCGLRCLRANIGTAIGSLLNTIGISEIRRARRLFDDILVLRQEHNNLLPLPHSQEDQLRLSNGWSDKGWMCLEAEDYANAEACSQKSLEIKRQWPEKDLPFEFAVTIKDIAFVRLSQKRSKDALDLMRHAKRLIDEDPESGPTSATVQKYRLYMAEMLACSGQIKDAIDLVEQVALGRKDLYPPFHPFNLDVCYVLGILYHYDNRHEQAEEMLRKTLSENVRDPYPEECKSRCLYALSEVLRQRGKAEEAEVHRKEAFRLLDKWRHLFMIEVTEDTHESVLFDHVVPLKCTRLSRYGKLWVGEIK